MVPESAGLKEKDGGAIGDVVPEVGGTRVKLGGVVSVVGGFVEGLADGLVFGGISATGLSHPEKKVSSNKMLAMKINRLVNCVVMAFVGWGERGGTWIT